MCKLPEPTPPVNVAPDAPVPADAEPCPDCGSPLMFAFDPVERQEQCWCETCWYAAPVPERVGGPAFAGAEEIDLAEAGREIDALVRGVDPAA